MKLWIAVLAGWGVGLALAVLTAVSVVGRHERSIYFRE